MSTNVMVTNVMVLQFIRQPKVNMFMIIYIKTQKLKIANTNIKEKLHRNKAKTPELYS